MTYSVKEKIKQDTADSKEFADYILSGVKLSGDISHEIVRGELVLRAHRDDLLKLMNFLHDDGNCQFKLLMDLCGVDYIEREERFDVVYNLLSVKYNRRIRVKVSTDEKTPVPSVVKLYPTACWFEREAWDMYGIFFSGNTDLRRILTDYGFDGHPLRKDYPLTGFTELRYDEAEGKIVTEKVNLAQAYRQFDDMNPWEGTEYIIPSKEDGENAA